jgi:urease accessory protein
MSAPACQSVDHASGWQALLHLGCGPRLGASRLLRRQHVGPLTVQKPLYPEGPEVCHCVILHPPGGIVGGDRLDIALQVDSGARLLATTPGAGKWYRSPGPLAEQRLAFAVGDGASLEWLPQENIFFDGAHARLGGVVSLAAGARYIGWDVACLGRTASGERFTRGALSSRTEILQAGRRLWGDYARIEGGARLLHASAGLAGYPVMGTLLAAGADLDRSLLDACRAVAAADGAMVGVTALPGVLAARYVGGSTQAARSYFVALWRILRPVLVGREACAPRIWNT